jgi:hypothetical protein
MAIADEKRKWRVLYYTKNGKPDKRRRPGFIWDPSVYAGPEKMTYCSVTDVDLGINNKPRNPTMKEGSNESIDHTLKQLSLQTYLKQVDTYEKILNPIQNILTNAIAPPPGMPLPHETGWGDEGKALPDAMASIGLMSPNWRDDRISYDKKQEEDKIRRKEKRLQKQKLFGGAASTNSDMTKDDVSSVGSHSTTRKSVTWGDSQSNKLLVITQGSDDESGKVSSFSSNGRKSERSQLKNNMKLSSSKSTTNVNSHLQRNDNKNTEYGMIQTPKSNQISPAFKEYESNESATSISTLDTAQKEAAALRALKRKERLQSRKREHVKIPWELMDQLEAEKQRFENEKNYYLFHDKF